MAQAGVNIEVMSSDHDNQLILVVDDISRAREEVRRFANRDAKLDRLCELLVARGIGIEAGLLSLADAHGFVASGIAPWCARAMVEPLDPDPEDAVAHAQAIEQALAEGRVGLEQVHHGDGIASWAVNRRAAARGHGIRTGLEDTPLLPDGRTASGNGELIAAAAALLTQLPI
jgi:uncharacterized protein (DUF849 family)